MTAKGYKVLFKSKGPDENRAQMLLEEIKNLILKNDMFSAYRVGSTTIALNNFEAENRIQLMGPEVINLFKNLKGKEQLTA